MKTKITVLTPLDTTKIINSLLSKRKQKTKIAEKFLIQGPGYTKRPIDHRVAHQALSKL